MLQVLYLLCLVSSGQADTAVVSPLPEPRHGVYVVAHRGAHEGIPENTLAAYREAIRLGCDFVEIDLRRTRDGRYVSVHNAEIDEYVSNGVTGRVAEMSLAELKVLDIGSRAGRDWAGERIPAFEEILELCKGRIGIYLDFKAGNVEEAAEIVQHFGMAGDVLWYIGGSRIDALRRVCPSCIPMPDPGPEKNLAKVLERDRPTVVAAVWKHYSRSFVEACHRARAKVIVDEDEPECWADAVAWGSDGIQTDRPGQLIAYLRNRPALTVRQPRE